MSSDLKGAYWIFVSLKKSTTVRLRSLWHSYSFMSLDNLNGKDVCGFNYLFGLFMVAINMYLQKTAAYSGWGNLYERKTLLAIKIILPPLNNWGFIAEINWLLCMLVEFKDMTDERIGTDWFNFGLGSIQVQIGKISMEISSQEDLTPSF